MIENLLDHSCDIYHLTKTASSPGYGLPSESNFSYPAKADLEGVSCHFGIKNSQVVVVQREPQQDYDARIKLTLPAGTDIRVNDKVVDNDSGYSYTAEIPRNIRGHHIIVYVKRNDEPRAL